MKNSAAGSMGLCVLLFMQLALDLEAQAPENFRKTNVCTNVYKRLKLNVHHIMVVKFKILTLSMNLVVSLSYQ